MPLKDSNLPDEWVAAAVAGNPITPTYGNDGKPDGNYRLVPGRLTWVHLVKPNPKPMNEDRKPDSDKPLYECTVLLPPGAQEQINNVLWPDLYAKLRADFPHNFDANGSPVGLGIPWQDQAIHAMKPNYAGYQPGLPFIHTTSQYKPQIVDPAGNPIVDERRVYPGVWAILLVNLFTYGGGKNPRPKKGGSVGLQGVMIVADDKPLSTGGQPDVKKAFAGVSIQPKFNAGAAFAAAPGAPPPPPGASFMPPPTTVAPPPAPQGGYAPPPAPPGAYAPPPAAPAAYAPPPGAYAPPPGAMSQAEIDALSE